MNQVETQENPTRTETTIPQDIRVVSPGDIDAALGTPGQHRVVEIRPSVSQFVQPAAVTRDSVSDDVGPIVPDTSSAQGVKELYDSVPQPKMKKAPVEVVLSDGSDEDAVIASADSEEVEAVLDDDSANSFVDENFHEGADSEIVVEFESEQSKADQEAIDANNKVESITEIVKSSTNRNIRILKSLKADPKDITLVENNPNDEDFRRMYVNSRYNMLSAPRAVRVPLAMSGYFAEISSYSHADAIGINRNAHMSDFVRRKELLMNALFSHIVYTSIKQDLDFETWASLTKLPDVETLYYGAYDANYYGDNTYVLTCGRCGTGFKFTTPNEKLGFLLDEDLPKDYLNQLLKMTGTQLFENPLSKKSNTKIKRLLNETKIYVEQKIPTVADYLETVRVLNSLASELGFNIESLDDPESEEFLTLQMYLYVSKIGLPVPKTDASGRVTVKYTEITSREQICTILSRLSTKDFDQLFEGPEIKTLFNMRSIKFFIKGAQCTNPKCKAHLNPVPLNMEEMYFFRLGVAMAGLRM